jgi:hypothetical protein
MHDEAAPADRVETTRRPSGGSRIGWSVFAGSVAATLLVFVLVTLGAGAVAGSYGVGAVLGAFCAGWGGIGFGVMFSGALAIPEDDRRPLR